jgi:hypothetical protein
MLIIDAAIRGSVILLLALAVTWLLRRRSAASRHAVWAGGIALQLLLPATGIWGPHWRVALPDVVARWVAPFIPVRAPLPERAGVTALAGSNAELAARNEKLAADVAPSRGMRARPRLPLLRARACRSPARRCSSASGWPARSWC